MYEERKGPMPVVETTFMSQHGQGAPSHSDDYQIGEALEAPPSSESPIRMMNPTTLINSSNKTTPTHSPRSRSRVDAPHEGQSFLSDFSGVEDVRTLQSELRRKKLALDEARRRCIVAEIELQTERLRSSKLEEEFHLCRRTLASRVSSTQDHDAGAERVKIEADQLRSSIEQKVTTTQTREVAILHKETVTLAQEKAKLKDHINSIWTEYQRYKENADLLIKELEAKLTEQRTENTPERITVESSESVEMRQENEKLRKQLGHAKAEIDQARSVLNKREHDATQFIEKLKAADGVQLRLKEQLAEKDRLNGQLTAQYETLQAEAAKLRETGKASASAKDQAGNLQRTIEKQHTQIKDLEKELEAAKTLVDKLKQPRVGPIKVDACVGCEIIPLPKSEHLTSQTHEGVKGLALLLDSDFEPKKKDQDKPSTTKNPFQETDKDETHIKSPFPEPAKLKIQEATRVPVKEPERVQESERDFTQEMVHTHELPRSHETTRTHELPRSQEPARSQEPSRSQEPTRSHEPSRSQEPAKSHEPVPAQVQNPEIPEQPEEMMDFSSESNPFDFFDKAASKKQTSPNPAQVVSRVSPTHPTKRPARPASNLFAASKSEEPDDFFELMAQEPAKRKYGNVPKSLFD